MSDIYWIILSYFTIGLAFVEGIRWAKGRWVLPPLNKLAVLLVFFLWPLVVLFSLVLIWRGKK